MSPSRFVATRLTPVEASDLWRRSDEASAFTRPDYLEQLVDEVEWWGAVDRSGEAVAAWPLVRAVAGGEIAPPPFCYYVGPMFTRRLSEDKYARYWAAYTDIFSTLASALASAHPRYRFSLPLGLTDIRALEWWNFDHPDEPGFSVTPRYTARIDLSQFRNEAELRRSFGANRNRAIDRWATSPPLVVSDMPAERVIDLHDQALKRSGVQANSIRRMMLGRMIGLARGGAGTVMGFRPQGQDGVAAAMVLLDGPNESNAIFYGATPAGRAAELTAWAVWQALLRAMALGKRWFDFNGANSPGRAADKHFYGAKAALYFNCSSGAK